MFLKKDYNKNKSKTLDNLNVNWQKDGVVVGGKAHRRTAPREMADHSGKVIAYLRKRALDLGERSLEDVSVLKRSGLDAGGTTTVHGHTSRKSGLSKKHKLTSSTDTEDL